MTELELNRKAEHRCIQCGKRDERTREGKVRCERCKALADASRYRRQLKRAREGRCINCGKELDGMFYTCSECRTKSTIWQRESRRRRNGIIQ